MSAYQDYSVEELRLQDYTRGNRGPICGNTSSSRGGSTCSGGGTSDGGGSSGGSSGSGGSASATYSDSGGGGGDGDSRGSSGGRGGTSWPLFCPQQVRTCSNMCVFCWV